MRKKSNNFSTQTTETQIEDEIEDCKNTRFLKQCIFSETIWHFVVQISDSRERALWPFPLRISRRVSPATQLPHLSLCLWYRVPRVVLFRTTYRSSASTHWYARIFLSLGVSGYRRLFPKKSNGTRIHGHPPLRRYMQISLPPSRSTARRREYESRCDERPLPRNRKSVAIRDPANSNKARCIPLYPALQLFHRSAAAHARKESAFRLFETWELISTI